MKTIIYLSNLNVIGGCEQWIYEIAKKYSEDYDIELYYKSASINQLTRLKKLIKCVRYNDEQINCDNLITAYNYDIFEKSNAKENILTIHANYEYEKLYKKIHPKVTKIYAVSEVAKKGFENTHKDQLDKLGLSVEVLYNPITLEKPKRVLRLISATRWSELKGSEEMKMIANKLNEKGYLFLWHVFTDTKPKANIDGFIFMNPRLDIEPFIKDADYLVQVSSSEGFSYSIVQSLGLGTPVVCKDILVREELGIKHKENGLVLNMDMSNIDEIVDLMYNNNLKGFNYQIKESDSEYRKIFKEKTKSKYKEEMRMKYLVEALPIWREKAITRTEDNKIPSVGEQWEVNKERLEVLLGNNSYKQPFVKLVKELKEEPIDDKEEYKRGDVIKELAKQEEDILKHGVGLSEVMYGPNTRRNDDGELVIDKEIKVQKSAKKKVNK